MNHPRHAMAAVALLAVFASNHSSFGQSFRHVPTLGGGFSEAHGVALTGDAAATADTDAFGEHAVLNRPVGGNLDLGTLGGDYSATGDISQDGLVVVGGSENGNGRQRAFRWTDVGGMLDLGVLTGGQTGFAIGASADGSVIVGWATNASAQLTPFRWTQATGMVALGSFGGIRGEALGVSLDGAIAVGYSRNGAAQNRPFRWTQADGMVDLGGTGGGQAEAANLDGSVIVGVSSNFPFRWTAGSGLVPIPMIAGAIGGIALDVTADGATVVGQADFNEGPRAFIWTAAAGMRDINAEYADLIPTGWVLERAEAVSADGRYIAGEGADPTGAPRGFILDVGPTTCPADWNDDALVNSADISAFLTSWLDSLTQGNLVADFNADQLVNSSDISAFLTAWLQGVQGGC